MLVFHTFFRNQKTLLDVIVSPIILLNTYLPVAGGGGGALDALGPGSEVGGVSWLVADRPRAHVMLAMLDRLDRFDGVGMGKRKLRGASGVTCVIRREACLACNISSRAWRLYSF